MFCSGCINKENALFCVGFVKNLDFLAFNDYVIANRHCAVFCAGYCVGYSADFCSAGFFCADDFHADLACKAAAQRGGGRHIDNALVHVRVKRRVDVFKHAGYARLHLHDVVHKAVA